MKKTNTRKVLLFAVSSNLFFAEGPTQQAALDVIDHIASYTLVDNNKNIRFAQYFNSDNHLRYFIVQRERSNSIQILEKA